MSDRDPATKGDIRGLSEEIRKVSETSKSDFRRLALEIVKTQASVAKFKDEIVEAIRKSQSLILTRMDRFMTATRKVSVEQTFFIHRLDKLEKRVDSLEARAP